MPGLTATLVRFLVKMRGLRIKTSRYVQEFNKENLKDISDTRAEINDEGSKKQRDLFQGELNNGLKIAKKESNFASIVRQKLMPIQSSAILAAGNFNVLNHIYENRCDFCLHRF